MKALIKIVLGILLAILFFVVVYDLKMDFFQLGRGFSNLFTLWDEAFPPDKSVFWVGLKGILETVEIAFIGTFLGMILSLPLGFLASGNLFSPKITWILRLMMAGIRTMPSLLWAVVFVILVGFGPAAGVFATAMYTMGYLTKLQYETIEGTDKDAIQALSGAGVGKLKLIRFAVWPQVASQLIGQVLFMFEYNVRASSVLGFVGAGGIGFYIGGYLKLLEYDKVFMLLIMIFIVIVVIDVVSATIRKRWLVDYKP